MTRKETYEFVENLTSNETIIEGIEVTSGINGYPKNLRMAVIGFSDFDAAQRFADENDGEVTSFSKRAGHSFWESRGNVYEEYSLLEMAEEDDQCSVITPDSIDSLSDFIVENLDVNNGEYRNFEQLKEDIEKMEKLWDCYQGLEDNEFIKRYDYDSYDVLPNDAMIFSEDSVLYAIGVELYNED